MYSTKDLIEFDGKGHLYRRRSDGMPIPGVTSILRVIAKEALIQWAANMASDYWYEAVKAHKVENIETAYTVWREAKSAHRDFSLQAANIGTEVHKYAEARLKSLPPPILETPQAIKGAEAFDLWLQNHDVQVGATERICFSQTHWYAGTCDFVGRIDGSSCVADFKTSSAIYPEMRLQTAAYQRALEDECGDKIEARWIVRFDKKTGAFEAQAFRSDHERDFQGFLSALNLSKVLKQIDER